MTDQTKDHRPAPGYSYTSTQEKRTFWASIRVALTFNQQRHRNMSGHDNITREEKDHHPTAWYVKMSAQEKNTFWACTAGWVLDAMDVQIFTFVIPAIMASFEVTRAQVGVIATATLLTSAFGGWFAGALSDRYGRVRMLRNTILWFAAFTFLCGFAQNYTDFFVLRAVMGLGFGGEWAAR
jgi:sugar phosphate permease